MPGAQCTGPDLANADDAGWSDAADMPPGARVLPSGGVATILLELRLVLVAGVTTV